MSQKWGII